MSEREQIRKAFATINHAIFYVGSDEPIAVDILKIARRALYDEKIKFTRYAQWTHFCERCPRYRDSPRD